MSRERQGAAPARTAPKEDAAAKPQASHYKSSRNPGSNRAPLVQPGRDVIDGPDRPLGRLRAAADQAAALFAARELDRTSAVAVLWPSVMAARIGSTTAIARLTAALNRAEESS